MPDTLADIPADKLVAVYRKIRGRMEQEKEAYEASANTLKEQLEMVSAQLLALCNAQNVDSLRTEAGTVTRSVKTRYWTGDWPEMYQFIKDNDAPFLLEQRIHNGNMKQFLEDHPDVMPVGLNVESKYSITVRKPTAKR